jgi:hypothetical protein
MALIGFEGFDGWVVVGTTTLYNNTTQSQIHWSSLPGFTLPAGTLGGKRIYVNNTATAYAYFGTQTDLIIGFRCTTNTATTSRDVITFRDSAFATQFGLSLDASSKLIFWRGTTATVLGTGTTTIVPDSEYFYEIKVTSIGATANVTVRINGVNEITLSSVDVTNTANNNVAYLYYTAPGGSGNQFDDLYIMNTSGAAPYNDFLGIIRVETLFPTTNNSVAWTPLSSTNASNVDETAVDSDTTYNSSTTPGNIDTFNHGALSSNPSTIYAVKTTSFAKKMDVSNRTYRNKLTSNVTTSNGTTYNLTTIYQMYEDIFLTDPNTAAAWANAAAVDATKIGYEDVA